jgi:hypothetical protein
MAAEVTTGSYTGTGAAINIELGFVPDYVEIFNATDGDASWRWFSGMAAGNALAFANHASAQQSLITSNGVTAYTPTDYVNNAGFTVGSALSESAKVFRYIAVRNGDW